MSAVNPPEYSLPRKLRSWRRERGVTQQELAKVLGVGQSTVSGWERGAMEPGFSKLVVLEGLIGVPAPPPVSPDPWGLPKPLAAKLAQLTAQWRARRERLINRCRYNPGLGRTTRYRVTNEAEIWGQVARELSDLLLEYETEVAA